MKLETLGARLDAFGAKLFYVLSLVMLLGVQGAFLTLLLITTVGVFTGSSSVYVIVGVVIMWLVVTSLVLLLVSWSRRNAASKVTSATSEQ